MPLPAAQPFVVEAKACSESTAPLALPALPEAAEPVRIAPVTVRVLAIAPPVETVADPVAASAIVPLDARRIARAALIRRAVRAQIEQQLPGEVAAWAQTITAQTIDLTQREVQREIARAMAAQVRAERSKHAVTAQF
jgi:regulator of protease activity HflC (stomatin/prohibitin superfamily)